MPALQLHCPHCGGLFQIDESLSGQHVACPLCANIVAIPELGSPPAGGPAAPPPYVNEPQAPPGVAAPPAAEEAFQLGCPLCGGAFQVTRAMAGQQIACPHCYGTVLLPEFGGAPTGPSAASWQAPAETMPPPSGAAFPPSSTPAAPQFETPAPQPTTVAPQPSQPTTAPVDALLPPGAEPKADTGRAARSRPVPVSRDAAPKDASPLRPTPTAPEDKAAEVDDLLPPGAKPQKPAKPVGAAAESPDELLPPAASNKAREEKKPQAAEPAAEVEELLPPSAKPRQPSVERSEVDELLPPGATKKSGAGPKAAAEETTGRPHRPGLAADGSVLIPTEEGGYVALREPVKTISVHGREVELRRLTPEEKAQRRFKRNLYVAVFGMLFLIVAMLVAGYLGGGF